MRRPCRRRIPTPSPRPTWSRWRTPSWTPCAGQGFDAWPLAAAPPIGRLVESLRACPARRRLQPDRGFGGSSGGEAHVTGLLELTGAPVHGVPVRGAGPLPLEGADEGPPPRPRAPRPRRSPWSEPGEPVPDLEGAGPWIVKPDGEDASLGIDQASVVTDRAALLGRVRRLHAAYGGRVVVEAYLPGPEFNVGVLALPEPAAAARSPRSCSTRPPAPGRS